MKMSIPEECTQGLIIGHIINRENVEAFRNVTNPGYHKENIGLPVLLLMGNALLLAGAGFLEGSWISFFYPRTYILGTFSHQGHFLL